jgi:hypothetical protein
MSELSQETAQTKKEESLALVARNAGRWIDLISDAAREFAASRQGEIVTGESMRQELEPLVGPPHHHNAWGAAIAKLVRAGVLKPTGKWVPMKGLSSNARRTPEYTLAQGKV